LPMLGETSSGHFAFSWMSHRLGIIRHLLFYRVCAL
jgi:hypothetical protein